MFFVKTRTNEDFLKAIKLVCEYVVNFEVRSFENQSIIKVTCGCDGSGIHDYNEDLRLCEMTFQLNFQNVCDECASFGLEICGHLTFTSYINR